LPRPDAACIAFKTGSAILAEQADDLMGAVPKGRGVRIMVTMPSEAADSPDLIQGLVAAGMDVMRVNCAHDSAREWESMIAHMRRANQESGSHCRVLMDLAGPKLRTGPIHRGSHVVRWKAGKNARGAAVTPARIALVGRHAGATLPPFDVQLPVPESLVDLVRLGDIVRIKDSRKRTRRLKVIHIADHACICSCDRRAYVLSRAELTLTRDDEEIETGHVGALPFVEEPIRLGPQDLLVLTRRQARLPGGSAICRTFPVRCLRSFPRRRLASRSSLTMARLRAASAKSMPTICWSRLSTPGRAPASWARPKESTSPIPTSASAR